MFHKVLHVFWNSCSLHVVKILEKYMWRTSHFCKVACCRPPTFLKMNSSICMYFSMILSAGKKTAMWSSYLQEVVKAAWGVLHRYVFIEHLPGYFLHWLQKLQFHKYNYIHKYNNFWVNPLNPFQDEKGWGVTSPYLEYSLSHVIKFCWWRRGKKLRRHILYCKIP